MIAAETVSVKVFKTELGIILGYLCGSSQFFSRFHDLLRHS